MVRRSGNTGTMSYSAGIFRGFLLAPLSVIPAAVILQLFMFVMLRPDDMEQVVRLVEGSLIIGVVGVMYAYGFVLFYILPVFLVLRKFARNSLLNCVLMSVIPSVLLFSAIENESSWLFLMGMSYFSMTVCAVFWLIVMKNEKAG